MRRKVILNSNVLEKFECSLHKHYYLGLGRDSISVKSIFYGLGFNWWKSIIDGQCHRWGEMVFDEGLHGGHKEPGYLKGITEASEYAVKVLSKEDLSIPIYQYIHKLACSHFSGTKESGTSIPESAGAFREHEIINEIIDVSKWGASSNEMDAIAGFPQRIQICAVLAHPLNAFGIDPAKPLGQVPEIYNTWYPSEEWEKLGPTRDLVVQAYIKMSNSFEALNKASFKKGAYFFKNSYTLRVQFTSSNIRDGAQLLFETFNANIKAAKGQDEKLVLIAELFQKLEWLHAPFDGTTRTDLIILNVFLAKYGFNPAILHEPVYATIHLLEEWISYLKQGMEAWRKEKEDIS
jgi:hypothetical protein